VVCTSCCRCRDLHRNSRSTARSAWSRQNESSSVHISCAGWSWPDAGHGLRAADQKDSRTDQSKSRRVQLASTELSGDECTNSYKQLQSHDTIFYSGIVCNASGLFMLS